MPITPATTLGLTDGQFHYRGLTFGRHTRYRVTRVEGLEGHMAARLGEREIPRGDGEIPGAHYLSGKRPMLTLMVVGDRAEVWPPLIEAMRVSRHRAFPLRFKVADRPERLIYARVAEAPVMLEGSAVVEHTIGLHASDPRVYSAAERQTLVPVYSADTHGYFNYDRPPHDGNYPKNADFADPSAERVARNAGDSDAYPTVQVQAASGQIDSFTLDNRTNGSQLQVDTLVQAGQTLTVRLREWVTMSTNTMIVELDGESRYVDWTSRPDTFFLSPGDNVLRLSVSGGDDVTCRVIWRDTWDGTITDQ